MRQLLYIFIASLFLVACDKKTSTADTEKAEDKAPVKEEIVVKGKFVGESLPDTIMILKSRGRNALPLNGGKVAKDGSFELALKDDELWVYFIQFGNKRVPFISDEKVIELTINADAQKPDVTYHNSREGQILAGMTPFINPDSLEKGKAYALENAPSFVSIIFAQQYINPKEDFAFFKELSSKYSVTEQPYSANFVNEVSKFDPNFLKVGSKIPNITLPNAQEEIVSLESLRGKVVLIDFWASWCGPCISEMPNVKKAYAKYHAKGFEVYGVSLDKDKDKWLGAIQRLEMPWVHVSDLKMWESPVVSQFKVEGIPFTILINEEGTILAKNLRGPYLDKQLAELF